MSEVVCLNAQIQCYQHFRARIGNETPHLFISVSFGCQQMTNDDKKRHPFSSKLISQTHAADYNEVPTSTMQQEALCYALRKSFRTLLCKIFVIYPTYETITLWQALFSSLFLDQYHLFSHRSIFMHSTFKSSVIFSIQNLLEVGIRTRDQVATKIMLQPSVRQ